MLKSRRFFATLFATALLGVGTAAPASAQPVVTGGLVNVTLTNVLNNNTVIVQVPIGIAANVCDVNAAAILAQVRDTGSATCNADAESIAFAEKKDRSGN